MTAFVAASELSAEQITMIRINTRSRLQNCLAPGAVAVRPLLASDLTGDNAIARLEVRDLAPGQWREIVNRVVRHDEAIGLTGVAAYSGAPQLDLVRIAIDDLEMPVLDLAVINTQQRVVVEVETMGAYREYRRAGYIDPPMVCGPGSHLAIAVLSHHGIAREDFSLTGMVAGRSNGHWERLP